MVNQHASNTALKPKTVEPTSLVCPLGEGDLSG
jgi:hypothetical protein